LGEVDLILNGTKNKTKTQQISAHRNLSAALAHFVLNKKIKHYDAK